MVAREDAHGDKILAAYLEARPGQPTPEVERTSRPPGRTICLPTWFLPPLSILDKLPLTPNGKIDRNALPAPIRNTWK